MIAAASSVLKSNSPSSLMTSMPAAVKVSSAGIEERSWTLPPDSVATSFARVSSSSTVVGRFSSVTPYGASWARFHQDASLERYQGRP